MNEKGKQFRRRNRRLPLEAYGREGAVTHLTLCTNGKAPTFGSAEVRDVVMRCVLDRSSRTDVMVYAFAVMPDHLHLLVSTGSCPSPGAYVRVIKGALSAELRAQFRMMRVWQKGSYDHVMRTEEDVKTTASYIVNNPVRKNLVKKAEDYPWCGSDVFELES